jgi:competence protein ComEC
MRVSVVSSDGALINKPLAGAGAKNPTCSGSEKPPADQTENLRSLGILITFGKLRILDLGDLTADKEIELMCPTNKLGRIDVYIASHHGWFQSGSAALVRGIDPRVAIMDNGAKKVVHLPPGTSSSHRLISKIFGNCTMLKMVVLPTMLPNPSSLICRDR